MIYHAANNKKGGMMVQYFCQCMAGSSIRKLMV